VRGLLLCLVQSRDGAPDVQLVWNLDRTCRVGTHEGGTEVEVFRVEVVNTSVPLFWVLLLFVQDLFEGKPFELFYFTWLRLDDRRVTREEGYEVVHPETDVFDATGFSDWHFAPADDFLWTAHDVRFFFEFFDDVGFWSFPMGNMATKVSDPDTWHTFFDERALVAEHLTLIVQDEDVGRAAPGVLCEDFWTLQEQAGEFTVMLVDGFNVFHKIRMMNG